MQVLVEVVCVLSQWDDKSYSSESKSTSPSVESSENSLTDIKHEIIARRGITGCHRRLCISNNNNDNIVRSSSSSYLYSAVHEATDVLENDSNQAV